MKLATRKRAAEAIAEFLALSGTHAEKLSTVCKRHSIAGRTFGRWLKTLETDAELASDVAKLRQPQIVDWNKKYEAAKQRVLNGLLKRVDDLEGDTAVNLSAVAEVYRMLAEQEREDRIATAYLNNVSRQTTGALEEAGPRVRFLPSGFTGLDPDDQLPEAEQASAGSVESPGFEEPQNAGSSVG